MDEVLIEGIDCTQYEEARTEANNNKLVAAIEGLVLGRLPITLLASSSMTQG